MPRRPWLDYIAEAMQSLGDRTYWNANERGFGDFHMLPLFGWLEGSRVVAGAVGSPKFSSGDRSMAIKRPTKSRGTPSRKPMPSVAVRHVDLTSKQHMVPGNRYVGWLCKNRPCAAVIAIALPPAGSKVAMPEEDQLTAIKCPHCGNEDLYRWSARSEHEYILKSAGN